MSTNYIFLHVSEHANVLIHGILSVLAGGFVEPHHKFCLVLVGLCDERLKRSIENYIEVRKQLTSKCKKMYQQELRFQILYDGNYCLDKKDDFLLDFDATNKDIWNICHFMSMFDIQTLKEGDTMTIVSSVDDSPTLAMYPYAVAMIEKMSFDIPIRHVCECKNDLTANLCKSILENFVDISSAIVIGLREDSYKTGITTMQVIETILDMSVGHAGQIKTASTLNLNYTQFDINSSRVARSLCRIDLLFCLLSNQEFFNRDIYQWMNRMELPSNFDFHKYFSMFGLTFLIYESFLKNMSDSYFIVERQKIYEDTLKKKLIASKSRLNGATNEEKRWIRFNDVVSALESIEISSLREKNNNKDYVSNGDISVELYDANIKTPSPTFLWELSNLSFCTSAMNLSEAKIVRSYCLDLWEIFYRYDKKSLTCSNMHVQEYLLPTSNTNMPFAFSVTKIGKKLCEDMYLYFVTGKEHTKIACTSPETGFAAMKNNIKKMYICDREYFDSSCPHELNERESGFQIFLYNYIRCIGGFSKEFTSYVSQQLNEKVQHEQDSKGLNLFKIYPEIGRHIGLEIVNKKDR